jgi:proline dehydrogenase
MKDDLTDKMAESYQNNGMPIALKVSSSASFLFGVDCTTDRHLADDQYIAYGSLGEVLPFLGRRAIENKSVMSGEGGAAAERKRITTELSRRWFGW